MTDETQPLPESTLSKLHRWTRNAIIWSVVAHFTFVVGAKFIIALRHRHKPQAVFQGDPPPRPRLEPRKLEMKVKVQNLQKRSARPRLQPRMLAMRPSEIALPEIKKDPNAKKRKVKRDFATVGLSGVGQGIGGGTGDGMGGGLGGGLPLLIADRCDPVDRARRLAQSGGTPDCEKAVMKSLRWLQKGQNKNGSWGQNRPVAMTGLALLAFLGHCETPDSPEFGPTVRKAMNYLIDRGKKGHGWLSREPYQHGIATYALAEAYSLTGDAEVRPVLEKAANNIVKKQTTDGGWVYNYDSKGLDTSIVGWQVQALKATHLGAIKVPGLEKCLDDAVAALKKHRSSNGHWKYRIDAPSVHPTLTGAGVFCLQMWKNHKSKEAKDGIDALLGTFDKQEYSHGKTSLYAWYYNTMACFQKGGGDWRKWNRTFRDEVLEAQRPNGSWNPEGSGMTTKRGKADADIYRTCLCTLMLEVYYRYLPASS